MDFCVRRARSQRPDDCAVEIVERKGLGHPDTVCDALAEAGDDGQAGRGNRVNGLITPGRTMTIGSVAEKNPVTHVGKLYNLTAGLVTQRIVEAVPDVSGAECRLVSRIGQPIDKPQIIDVQLFGVDPETDASLVRAIDEIVRDELERLPDIAGEFVRGEIELDRWPLRSPSTEDP